MKTDSTASSFELVQSDELPLSVHSSFEHVNPDDIPRWESISNLRQIDFKKECPDQLNMSFAGCGFLGIYHLGVAKALQVCRSFRTASNFLIPGGPAPHGKIHRVT